MTVLAHMLCDEGMNRESLMRNSLQQAPKRLRAERLLYPVSSFSFSLVTSPGPYRKFMEPGLSPRKGKGFSLNIEENPRNGHYMTGHSRILSQCGENPKGNKEIWELREMS